MKKVLIIRMEVRDQETWAVDKSISVALEQEMMGAFRSPYAALHHHVDHMFDALKGWPA